jgi:hypothetical protein
MYTVLHTVHEDCMKTFTRLRRDVQSEIRWLGRGTDAVHKVLVEEVAATSPDAVMQVRVGRTPSETAQLMRECLAAATRTGVR